MQDIDVKPGGHDFSRAHAVLQDAVERELLPGVSAAVLDGPDCIALHCCGWADRERGEALRPDHLFRVFSNTKLVTSIAALLLLESGHFELDDPIERYIPALGRRQVLRAGAKDIADTEPAARSITVRHLLTHSSGLSYGLFDPGSPMFLAYQREKVMHPGRTLAEMMEVLGRLPLSFHPGSAWQYSVASDVVARLVEVLSGRRFDEFLRERIFGPLGMSDTGFVVPPQNVPRLATLYAGADGSDPLKPGLSALPDYPYRDAYLQPVPRLNGGGGLISSLPDTLALLRSLLRGGPTLLQPATVELMMRNHLPPGVWLDTSGTGPMPGRGHGLAGAVIVETTPPDHPAAAGEFFWSGLAGTQWWVHPPTNTAGALMTQRHLGFAHPFYPEYKRCVYEALTALR